MAHVSLYRKYRSQTFGEVVGQEHITTTLANALAEDRLHHAYLFTGPRGTGKTSTARILAKSVNCVHGPTPEPCNVCEQCTAITAGSSVDVIEIDAASHGGVDDVRDLRDRIAFAPATARMKVYIVDECHMLSTAGWNAFLKTVEEPPGHVLFVFATTEPHKVLDTILSRTQRFDFKRIPAPALLAHCIAIAEKEQLTVEPGAMDLVVRAGDGSARDTLSVLDHVIAFAGREVTVRSVTEVLGTVGEDLLGEAADCIARGDVPGVCALVGRLADSGQDLRQFARDAVEHLRSLLLLKAAPDAGLVEGTPERLAALRAEAGTLGQVELLRAIELLADAQALMRRGNTRLPLEVALIKAALPEACGDPAALAARMDRLERRTGVNLPPAAEDPVRPAADNAGADRSAVDKPAARPAADKPPADKPAADRSAADKPPADRSAPEVVPSGEASPAGRGAAAEAAAGAAGGTAPGADAASGPEAAAGAAGGTAPDAAAPPGPDSDAERPAPPAAPAPQPAAPPGAASAVPPPTAGAAPATSPTPAAHGGPSAAAGGASARRDGAGTTAPGGKASPTDAADAADAAEAADAADAAGPVDLELVARSWPAVVEAVKGRSRRLHAFLSPARPTGVGGGVLTLAFAPTYGFHAEQCASEEWQGPLGEVFATVLGASLRVRCTVSDGDDPAADVLEEDPDELAARREAEAVLETEAQEAAGELPDDAEVHDLAVETLTRDLGAVVVEDT